MGEVQSVDVWILVITGASVLLAYSRGFTAEMLKLGVYVCSMALGVYLAPLCAPLFSSFSSYPKLPLFLSFFTASALSWIVLKIIAGRMTQAVRKSSLSKLDKSLGIVFGLFRGFALVLILYFLICLFSSAGEEAYRKNSRLFNYVGIAADSVRAHLTEQFGIKLPRAVKKDEEENDEISEDETDSEAEEDSDGTDKPPAEDAGMSGMKGAFLKSVLENAEIMKIRTPHGKESVLDAAAEIMAGSYSGPAGQAEGSKKISKEDMLFLIKFAVERMSEQNEKDKARNQWWEKQGVPLVPEDLVQLIKEKQNAENTGN